MRKTAKRLHSTPSTLHSGLEKFSTAGRLHAKLLTKKLVRMGWVERICPTDFVSWLLLFAANVRYSKENQFIYSSNNFHLISRPSVKYTYEFSESIFTQLLDKMDHRVKLLHNMFDDLLIHSVL